MKDKSIWNFLTCLGKAASEGKRDGMDVMCNKQNAVMHLEMIKNKEDPEWLAINMAKQIINFVKLLEGVDREMNGTRTMDIVLCDMRMMRNSAILSFRPVPRETKRGKQSFQAVLPSKDGAARNKEATQ